MIPLLIYFLLGTNPNSGESALTSEHRPMRFDLLVKRSLPYATDQPIPTCFDVNSRYIVAGYVNGIRAWNTNSLDEVWHFSYEKSDPALARSSTTSVQLIQQPANNKCSLVTFGTSGIIRTWNLHTGTQCSSMMRAQMAAGPELVNDGLLDQIKVHNSVVILTSGISDSSGDLLCSARQNGSIDIWSTRSAARVRRICYVKDDNLKSLSQDLSKLHQRQLLRQLGWTRSDENVAIDLPQIESSENPTPSSVRPVLIADGLIIVDLGNKISCHEIASGTEKWSRNGALACGSSVSGIIFALDKASDKLDLIRIRDGSTIDAIALPKDEGNEQRLRCSFDGSTIMYQHESDALIVLRPSERNKIWKLTGLSTLNRHVVDAKLSEDGKWLVCHDYMKQFSWYRIGE